MVYNIIGVVLYYDINYYNDYNKVSSPIYLFLAQRESNQLTEINEADCWWEPLSQSVSPKPKTVTDHRWRIVLIGNETWIANQYRFFSWIGGMCLWRESTVRDTNFQSFTFNTNSVHYGIHTCDRSRLIVLLQESYATTYISTMNTLLLPLLGGASANKMGQSQTLWKS